MNSRFMDEPEMKLPKNAIMYITRALANTSRSVVAGTRIATRPTTSKVRNEQNREFFAPLGNEHDERL